MAFGMLDDIYSVDMLPEQLYQNRAESDDGRAGTLPPQKLEDHLFNLTPELSAFNHKAIQISHVTKPGLEPFFIFSADGGGTRGIIIAQIVNRIEQWLSEKRGEQVQLSEAFDAFAGTSTGSLIALGLTKPDPENPTRAHYSGADIVKLYKKRIGAIFSTSLERTLWTGDGLWKAKYDPAELEKTLQEKFADSHLSELLKDVVIPSFDISRWQDHTFTHIKEDRTYTGESKSGPRQAKGPLIADVARASSAAPTYFPSKVVKENSTSNKIYNLVDGGTFANNPAEEAYWELLERRNLKNRKVFILSIGTGTLAEKPLATTEPYNAGIGQWAPHIVNLLMNANSYTVNKQLKRLEESRNVSYLRMQLTLKTNAQYKMDNSSPKNLEQLIKLANDFFDKLLSEGLEEKLLKPLLQRVSYTLPLEDVDLSSSSSEEDTFVSVTAADITTEAVQEAADNSPTGSCTIS